MPARIRMSCQPIKYGQIWNNLPLRLKALLIFLIPVPALLVSALFLTSTAHNEVESREWVTAHARQNLPPEQAHIVEAMMERAGEARRHYDTALMVAAASCGLSLVVAMLVFTGSLSAQLRLLASNARGISTEDRPTLENWEANVLSHSLAAVEGPVRPRARALSAVSHDVRSQLTGIIGLSGLLHEGQCGELSARQIEYVADILTSARSMLAIIERDLAPVEPHAELLPVLTPAASANMPASLVIVSGKSRNRNPTEQLLRAAGYSVQTAGTESEVRLRCENQLFDAIVFDLEPSSGGSLQMLSVIRESGLNAFTPVIGLSIAGSAGDAGNDQDGQSTDRLRQVAAYLRGVTSKPSLGVTATAFGSTAHGV